MSDYIFHDRKERYRFILPREIFDEIHKECKRRYPNEAGGVLIGKYENSYNDAVVKKIINCGKEHGPLRFELDGDYASHHVNLIHVETKGDLFPIGYWHSHPDARPDPSDLDIKTTWEDAYDFGYNAIMMIVGHRLLIQNVKIFVFNYETHDIIELKTEWP